MAIPPVFALKAASVGGLFQSPPRRAALVGALHAVAVAITQPKKRPQRLVGEPRPSVCQKADPPEKGASAGLFQRSVDRGKLVIEVGPNAVDDSNDRERDTRCD